MDKKLFSGVIKQLTQTVSLKYTRTIRINLIYTLVPRVWLCSTMCTYYIVIYNNYVYTNKIKMCDIIVTMKCIKKLNKFKRLR